MKHVKLHVLASGMTAMGNMEAFLQDKNLGLAKESVEQLRGFAVPLRDLLVEMELKTSEKSANRLIAALDSWLPEHPRDFLRTLVSQLVICVKDEAESVTAYWVPAGKIQYLYPEPFGPEVQNRFRSANHDIEEAGKCLSFNRNTAAVFHLMRVMETGLRALGRSLNDPNLDPKRNPSWEMILRKCDQELQKTYKDRAPEWTADEAFFSTATANLRAVKDAWRNPTMHVEKIYDEDLARGVWDATRAFMRHLATKLSE
ncbi:MAG TPA: hypothetical protein VF756_16765 [Thermoanaerobaculia bacterium]